MGENYRLLIFFPGPIWDLKDAFSQRLQSLSERYQGVVFTVAQNRDVIRFGNFSVETIGISEKYLQSASVQYIRTARYIAKRGQQYGKPFHLIVSYDPLLTGMAAWIAGKVANTPFVCEANGEYADTNNYVDMTNQFAARVKRQVYTQIVRFILSQADGIRLLYPEQLYYYSPKKDQNFMALFDYTDLRHFHVKKEKKRILFAGYPFRRKGVDVLIDAFKKVARKYPDWELRILGWYPDKEELARYINGHPSIHHHPPVPHHQMPEQVGDSAIVVLPSRSEAMGRILLEAKAAGKPAIGARVGGIPNVIEHGGDGFLFAPENVEELAGFLDMLMGDAGLRHKMGARAKQKALEEYAMDTYFKKIGDFYRRVIEQSSKH